MQVHTVAIDSLFSAADITRLVFTHAHPVRWKQFTAKSDYISKSCLPYRSLARKWIVMLFMGTCFLYCARMAMPVCAVSMAATFHWSKIDSGLVLGGFFWGYCLTQILGGHVSDR